MSALFPLEASSSLSAAESASPLAQTEALGRLGQRKPAPITPAYEQQADPVIETQLEKAGVRLAYLLNAVLKLKCLAHFWQLVSC